MAAKPTEEGDLWVSNLELGVGPLATQQMPETVTSSDGEDGCPNEERYNETCCSL
jgi:hypothetical protein